MGFSPLHWLVLIFCLLATVVPLWKILPRAGMPSALSLFAILPLGAIILWWVVAFKRWPGDA